MRQMDVSTRLQSIEMTDGSREHDDDGLEVSAPPGRQLIFLKDHHFILGP
jgi:hypothetical protein